MAEKLTDNSLMPFGKYIGQKLANVPNDYLLFLYENQRGGRITSYLEENIEVIRQLAIKERSKRK